MLTTKVLPPRVLVLGTGSRAASFAEAARKSSSGGRFNIVGYLPLKSTTQFPLDETECRAQVLRDGGAHVLAAGESVMNVVRTHRINEIVTAMSDSRNEGLSAHERLDCRLRGVKISASGAFFERERRQLHIDSLDADWTALNDGFRQSFTRRVVKRLFDVTASAGLLIATLPVMLITALSIAIESGAPVLYFQKRVGRRGRVFTIFKFRSMAADAEVEGGPRWAAVDDTRVTRVGRIIRKLRIDELPQIFNVFNGDMSFVGPRPERPYFVEQLASKIRHYDARHSVKPGITGWAQVSYPYGASHSDAVEKCQYDLYYVKNHTLFMDLAIVLGTVGVVLGRKGAR